MKQYNIATFPGGISRKAIAFAFAFLMISGLASKAAQRDTTSTGQSPVCGGLLLQANCSGYILHDILDGNLRSRPGAGAEIGGFLDYNVTRHFTMKMCLMLASESSVLRNSPAKDRLSTFGMDIPLYLLWRFNTGKGTAYLGGGVYTHFIFGAKISGDSNLEDPFKRVVEIDEITGEERFALSDSHSGIGLLVEYEFAFGLRINISYKQSCTDILNYTHSGPYVLPYKLSVGLGYRF